MKQFYTYLYKDPKDGTPRYMGKGHDRRAWSHFNSKFKTGCMLRKRVKEGYDPQPIIVYHKDEKIAHAMEIFWIAVYGREDLGLGTLFNLTAGGEGTINPSAEARAKTSAAQKGKITSDATKEKIRSKNRGRPGKKHTEEHKLYIAGVLTGKAKSAQHIENMKGPHKLVVCPHCNKEGGLNAMNRWHFDKCRNKGAK